MLGIGVKYGIHSPRTMKINVCDLLNMSYLHNNFRLRMKIIGFSFFLRSIFFLSFSAYQPVRWSWVLAFMDLYRFPWSKSMICKNESCDSQRDSFKKNSLIQNEVKKAETYTTNKEHFFRYILVVVINVYHHGIWNRLPSIWAEGSEASNSAKIIKTDGEWWWSQQEEE